MRVAVIHHSIHHHNTAAIAQAMATAVGGDSISLTEARGLETAEWDVLGLGSGIFFGKHHLQLLEFALHRAKMPPHCFVFSTAGIRSLYRLWHQPLVRVLQQRNCQVIGQFCSPGWDTVGPLKFIGGIHRGRPNARDLRRAALFATQTIDHYRDSIASKE